MTASRKRRPAPAYDIPLDSSSWWPLAETVDEYRARHTLRGEQPVYFTEEREAAIREWGERAGLANVELPHERAYQIRGSIMSQRNTSDA